MLLSALLAHQRNAHAPGRASAAASHLRDRGFAVLDHDPLDSSLVRPAATAICSELDELLDLATRLGCDANEQHYRFSEVCHRARLRWDMRVPDAAVDKLVDAAVERAMPVLRELDALPLHPDERRLPLARRLPLRPRVLMTGAIVSKRGATAQRFHSDAQRSHFFWSTLLPRHRLFNLFVPLVDVEQDGFGTQFWPGSHLGRTRLPRYRAAIERSGSIEDDEEAMAAMEAPACRAGGLMLFDYRTMHRGLPNLGCDARPVAYAVIATGAAWDTANFPENSLRASVASIEEAVGDDLERLEALRDATATYFPRWDELECDPSCVSF